MKENINKANLKYVTRIILLKILIYIDKILIYIALIYGWFHLWRQHAVKTDWAHGDGRKHRAAAQPHSSTTTHHHRHGRRSSHAQTRCETGMGSSHHAEGLPAHMPCCSEPAPSKTQIESLQLLSRLFRNTISSLCFSGFFFGQFLRSGMLMKASPLNRCFTKDGYGIKKAAPFLSMYCRREPVYLELIVRIKGRRGTSFFCSLQTIKKEQ
jgi:hypothetical protein